MATPDQDKALVGWDNQGKPNQNEALQYNPAKTSGYRLADYPLVPAREARIAIKAKLDRTTITVQVAPLIASDLPEAPGELVGPAAKDGVVFVNAYNDGTENTWEILHGQPVVFDTVTGRGVTGINPKWSRNEYKVVGTAWKSHREIGWARIPVKLQTFEYDPDYTYCAVPVCGTGIPARANNNPGSRECCIFTLEGDELVPVMINNRTGGQEQLREIVYNVRDTAVPIFTPPREKYILVHEMAGYLVCENPDTVSSGNESTTTTEEPGEGAVDVTIDTTNNLCSGRCRYYWVSTGVSSDGYWELDEEYGGCSLKPTTTTTSTYDPNSGGGTPGNDPNCLCQTTTPLPTSSTSSTSSSSTSSTSSTSEQPTTTTPYPCQCSFPTFCGEYEGECTFTGCFYGFKDENETKRCSSTSSTSTSTCNCNSTTSSTISPGCSTCTVAGSAYIIWGDHVVENGCLENRCYCPTGNASPDPCVTQTIPCDRHPPAHPPGPCEGTCQWGCYPDPQSVLRWYLLNPGVCTGGYGSTAGGTCRCPNPSSDGLCDACQAVTETECESQTYVTPAPPPYCPNCVSTTSTSTTPKPCGNGCIWEQDGSGWTIRWNLCGSGCACTKPGYDPDGSCVEIAHTPCFQGSTSSTSSSSTTTGNPTTTSSSTTTTTTQTPWWCQSVDVGACDGTLMCVEGPADEIFDYCQGPFTTEMQCVTGCLSSTTTTSTTPAPWKCCKDIAQGGCVSGNPDTTCVESPDPCPSGYIECTSYASSALCLENCVPPPTTTSNPSTTTTTCNPAIACTSHSCVMNCPFDDPVFELLNICETTGTGHENCSCNPTDEELALVGTACNGPEDNFAIGCCNHCNLPGNVNPCATTTTTTTSTPAP